MLLMHVMPVAIPSLGTEFKSPSPTRSLDKQTKKKTKTKSEEYIFPFLFLPLSSFAAVHTSAAPSRLPPRGARHLEHR